MSVASEREQNFRHRYRWRCLLLPTFRGCLPMSLRHQDSHLAERTGRLVAGPLAREQSLTVEGKTIFPDFFLLDWRIGGASVRLHIHSPTTATTNYKPNKCTSKSSLLAAWDTADHESPRPFTMHILRPSSRVRCGRPRGGMPCWTMPHGHHG